MRLRILSVMLLTVMLFCSCTPTVAPQPTEMPTFSVPLATTLQSTMVQSTQPDYLDTFPAPPDPYIQVWPDFDSYEELLTFIDEETAKGSDGLTAGPQIKLFFDKIAEKGLWVPYVNGEQPQVWISNEGPWAMTLYTVDWYYRCWLYIRCSTEAGDRITVRITPLEEELEVLARESTALEVHQAIYPHIYERLSIALSGEVAERKVITAAGEKTAFVWTENNGYETIKLTQDHWLIDLRAEEGIITDEWLKGFELRPFTTSEQ